MDTRGNRAIDFVMTVVLVACAFVIGVAIGDHERKCPAPRSGNVMLHRQGLEVYSTEELLRIIAGRRRMERIEEKRK